ncbi:MAG TPA: hypothetical protein ENN09_01075, partial [Planctomycetes bacterium]|nr:hypothetical protein [Planctomycetota bacterium]
HSLIESGAIIHAFVGEKRPSAESVFALVKKTWENTQAAQITISPEFTVCRMCKAIVAGSKSACPRCGTRNIPGIAAVARPSAAGQADASAGRAGDQREKADWLLSKA